MGRYAAPRGELPRRRRHEEAMRAKVPGKTSHLTRHSVQQSHGLGLGHSQRIECSWDKKVRVNMSILSDSGFEEDLHSPSPSPSPSPQHLTGRWSGPTCDRLTAECLHINCDESCFIIQRNNQENFLALDCLARQPQVTGILLILQ